MDGVGAAGGTGDQFVLGAYLVVTSLTRSVRYIVQIEENGTGNPSPTAGMAGGKCVHGAYLVVTSLTRSVRYVCADRGELR